MFNTLRVGYNRFYQKFETSDCPVRQPRRTTASPSVKHG